MWSRPMQMVASIFPENIDKKNIYYHEDFVEQICVSLAD